MNNEIYISAIKQISVQSPLTDDWADNPVFPQQSYCRADDPDFKQYFSPNEARRLGKILKRALITSREALKAAGTETPDAIITGTGLGCIENTEIFLDKLVRGGEQLLNPTHFMNSTHNTISSLVAIDTTCKGYNSTYANNGISFECALQDAVLGGGARTVLVGAHDEMTPQYFEFLKKAGYFKFPTTPCGEGSGERSFAGETAVAMVISNEKTDRAYCRIEGLEKVYGEINIPFFQKMEYLNNVNYIMTGINGVPENDRVYYENCKKWFPDIPLLHYKHVFGESYTAPALGLYAAALCLKNGKIPEFLHVGANAGKPAHKILCYNQFENKHHTFILLSKC
jgi:3-oxoacyl-(acyl-carrier-protein) synthase